VAVLKDGLEIEQSLIEKQAPEQIIGNARLDETQRLATGVLR
jgi:hypothetical protein